MHKGKGNKGHLQFPSQSRQPAPAFAFHMVMEPDGEALGCDSAQNCPAPDKAIKASTAERTCLMDAAHGVGARGEMAEEIATLRLAPTSRQ